MDPDLVTYLDRRFTEQSEGFRKEMATRSEMDRQFREVHVLIESLDSKIELVAEGVSANYEANLRLAAEMGRQFEEVKSMLRPTQSGPG